MVSGVGDLGILYEVGDRRLGYTPQTADLGSYRPAMVHYRSLPESVCSKGGPGTLRNIYPCGAQTRRQESLQSVCQTGDQRQSYPIHKKWKHPGECIESIEHGQTVENHPKHPRIGHETPKIDRFPESKMILSCLCLALSPFKILQTLFHSPVCFLFFWFFCLIAFLLIIIVLFLIYVHNDIQ